MDTAILEDIGLTHAEIKIYLALNELGLCTAGPILDRTGLQNSVVHMTLHKLVEKGFVSYIIKGKTRYYRATSPQNVLKFIDDKRKRFEQIIPELLVQQQPQEKQEAEIYQGFTGFKNMLYEFISDGKQGDEFLFFVFYAKDKALLEKAHTFYREYEKERKERGFIIKGIVTPETVPYMKGRDMSTLLIVDFPIPTNISIFHDKVIFTLWEDNMVSYMIHSRQLADSFRQYFYSIWNKYKVQGKKSK